MIYVNINPPLPVALSKLSDEECLSFEDFKHIQEEYILSYLVGGEEFDYGKNSLFITYVSVCEELDKLEAGENHDLCIAYYPLFSIEMAAGGVLCFRRIEADALKREIATTSIENLREPLQALKASIESWVTQRA